MDLRRKLANFTATQNAQAPAAAVEADPAPASEAPKDRIEQLRGLIRQLSQKNSRPAAPAPEPTPLPGERVETPAGWIRLAENWLSPDHCHGKIPIAQARQVPPKVVAELALDPNLSAVDFSRALFIDTETTGLAGGTGTVPFLVGCAQFEDDSFRLSQFFLEQPGEEAPLLEALRAKVEAASCIVSYNGKSFDWPLLLTRFVMARVPPPAPRPHLDLLHCSRRIYRPRLGTVRLVEMETEILGKHRERDIDGAEIPGLYWSFLRHRDGSQMALVMEHNANDLVALAAILVILAEKFATLHLAEDPQDQLARAKLAARAKNNAKALLFADAAAQGGGQALVTAEACWVAAKVKLSQKRWEEAQVILETGLKEVERRQPWSARLHLELSKLFEHRLKNLEKALAHATRTEPAEGAQAHRHRVERLQKKNLTHPQRCIW